LFRSRVIPTLLLKDSGLVKTVKFKNPVYLGDPRNVVKIFNDKEVDELVLLDIQASIENRSPLFDLISEIASECFMPLGYGGGIRSLEDIKKLMYIGIDKVIINTNAIENPDLIKEASSEIGNQNIIVSLDIKRNFYGRRRVYIKAGRKSTRYDPVELAVKMQSLGAGELLINSIDFDGTMNGYDSGLIKNITDAVDIPVIACGGAGKFDDLVNVIKDSGASAAAAGSLFVFHGVSKAVLINFPTQIQLREIPTSY